MSSKQEQLRKSGTLVVIFIFQVQIFGFDVGNRPTTDLCSTHTILPGPKGDEGEKGDRGEVGKQGKLGPKGLKGNEGPVGDVGDQGMLGKIGPIGGKVIAGIRETDEKFYYIVKEEKNYREALLHCRDRGGTLAMPKDEVTNTLLADYISSSGLFRAFIGLSDMEKEGQFVYADNSPLQNYSHWKAGEPHDPAGREDCVEMLSTGEWNDSECQVTIYFVCEFLKRRK
ncbi:collectin-10 isoform X3 [Melanerpes formicivorus]|uniref:collectin-10 isoform X3 n=1 Tax=Melanerpes formicivorus TaxID=211600 RepID=UPI00358F5E32